VTSQNDRPKQKMLTWKSVVVAAVALVIVWQLFHALTNHSGNAARSSQGANGSSSQSQTAVPSTSPTPRTTVTLGGRQVAGQAGPLIILNPGLVAAGGQVGVDGSGFRPGAPVTILLKASRSSYGTVVAHAKTSSGGTVTASFTMPTSGSGSGATVVAEQNGGVSASAQLTTPGGVGTMSIVGKAAGKPGDSVTVSASGFGAGERINVYWGRTVGTPAATLTADGSGTVGRASVPVGVAPVGTTTMVLVGQTTHTTATAAYQMLGLYPTTASHPYAVKSGHPMTFTGNEFAPDEQVLIYLNSTSGMPALTATASSTGGFSTSFVVPFGLKGSQTLTAVGSQSRAAVSSGFDVLPYNPTAQASTYGAMPGTALTFYATGFAANEVVLVYAGGGHGQAGTLVSAFRVNSMGSAGGAGHYVVPSGVGPGLYFNLVGQQSGGSATAKVSVTAPAQPVNVPSQPPYVLPPSLGGKAPAQPGHSPGQSPSQSPPVQSGQPGPSGS
jgi:hypothetical protein